MTQTMPIAAVIAPVTPLQQNCTIVWCTKTMKAAVIDPGGEIDRLLKAIADKGLTLEKIWITHGHMDHAGGAAELKARTGVPIEGPHKDDQFWIDRIQESGEMYGIPEARIFVTDRWLDDGTDMTPACPTLVIYNAAGERHRLYKISKVGMTISDLMMTETEGDRFFNQV